MEPIAESVEVLRRLATTDGSDLAESLTRLAAELVETIPQCVGLSISYYEDGVTITFLATSERLRILDAAQYLTSGPCEDAARDGETVEVPDIMNEDRWSLLAQAAASVGVTSSLSLPLRHGDNVYGSVNLYGRTTDAFQGRETDIARIFATQVGDAVTNADLSMSSLARARESVDVLDAQDVVSRAAGVLAGSEKIQIQEAVSRLYEAARRAAVPPAALADLIIRQRQD